MAIELIARRRKVSILPGLRRCFEISMAACFVCLSSGFGLPKPTPTQPATERLRSFFAAEWEYQLREHPEYATYVGDARYNDRLGDQSPAAYAREAAHTGLQLRRLQAIPETGLSEQDRVSRQMMVQQMQSSLESFRLKEWEMPISQINGIHLDLASMYAQMPFRTTKDYENYLARLHAIPAALDQTIAIMRLGMRDHMMQPRYLLEEVPAEAEQVANAAPEKSPFAEPLKKFPEAVSRQDRERLGTAILTSIRTEVEPAYAHFAAFVKTQYAPAGRAEPGVWALPDGKALYLHEIRVHTQTNETPDQIFATGMQQVRDIEQQMLALAKSRGYSDLPSFHKHIREDRELYVKSADQLMRLYSGYEDQMRGRLPELVMRIPSMPLEVVPMDSFRAPTAVPADYSPGSTAGGRPGRVNVNLYDPTKRLTLNIEAIAYHEGLPGHHLQFATADALKDLPPFRRYSSYDSYSEGWALYAEQLAHELGYYRDPYSEYGRLQNEMWRSVRLVVDTGVHAKHWSRHQMVDFFRQHTAMDDQNINTEVDRYISWPAQALAYRLGEMKIIELRERAKQRLGSRYDVRKFHQHVLDLGPVPLDGLDASITRWLDRETVPGH
jgi:uncharacterized protein (DUF885 family)